MRIVVYEFCSGGGLAGRPVPASLGREGAAMRSALVADLSALGRHRIVVTQDPRYPISAPHGVEVVTMPVSPPHFDTVLDLCDAAWIVAPETNGCLERLSRKVERAGKILLGSSSRTIRAAADKAALPRRLVNAGIPHPPTSGLASGADHRRAARELGYPVVVKPSRGAGCEGISMARNLRELDAAVKVARQATSKGDVVLQQYVRGVAASVSLVADGRRATALTLNAQKITTSRRFSYLGGATPLEHPLAQRAVQLAIRACESIPGLRGYVGVDLVLTNSEAFVIEINPRLTTAFIGVRSAVDRNVAGMVLDACNGARIAPPVALRRVAFTSAGVCS